MQDMELPVLRRQIIAKHPRASRPFVVYIPTIPEVVIMMPGDAFYEMKLIQASPEPLLTYLMRNREYAGYGIRLTEPLSAGNYHLTQFLKGLPPDFVERIRRALVPRYYTKLYNMQFSVTKKALRVH